MPFVFPFWLYSDSHISSQRSLTKKHISILWSGCQLTQGEIQCSLKRLYPYLSWHLSECSAPVHYRKVFCSCFKGCVSRLRKEDIKNEWSSPMFLSQCCTKCSSDVFRFWARSKEQLPNCLVMETTCRHHSIHCLRNRPPPIVNKTEWLCFHFFSSPSIKHLCSINHWLFLGVIYSYGTDLLLVYLLL